MEGNEVPIIRELPKSMINKIAAGEVVERPANVVKELVENAIDAGATKIDVEVEKSGVELVKVIDNGCGIPDDQLELALTPHATSKISEPKDLFNISTLGFRGEALASIAEISHLILTSRASGAASGARVRCDGEAKSPVEACGRNVGTTVEVRDLFFNTPVRRKFLKSSNAEYGYIKDALTRLAIPHPEIAFTLRRDKDVELDLPVARDMLDRIRRLFGDKVANSLIRVDYPTARKDVVISGYVGRPDLYRGSTSMQFLFVNGRFFKDKALGSALKAAYQGLLKQGMYPVVFLNVTTPLDFVDVNVHPTKQEVRFVDGQTMYSGMLHSVRDNLNGPINLEKRPSVETIARAAGVEPPKPESSRDPSAGPAENEDAPRELTFVPDVNPYDPQEALSPELVAQSQQRVDEWFSKPTTDGKSPPESAPTPTESVQTPTSVDENVAPVPTPRAPRGADERDIEAANSALAAAAWEDARSRSKVSRIPPYHGGTPEFKKFPSLGEDHLRVRPRQDVASRSEPNFDLTPSAPPASNVSELAPAAPEEPISALSFDERRARVRANSDNRAAVADRLVALTSDGRPVVQFCDRYLVLEAPDGIALVDQHALHERILYEKFKAQYDKGKILIQRLVVPEVVELSATECVFATENAASFKNLGIIIDSKNSSEIEVQGYPAVLGGVSPRDIFLTAFGVLYEKRPDAKNLSDILEGALAQMACKAAIKAGDKLSRDEVVELVARAEMEAFAHHCPHGRPSTVVFTTKELDKFFIRD